MLKKTITYTNPFTEESVTQDFYFNINKAEATKLAMTEGAGMDERIRTMMATNEGKAVLEIFDRIIGLAYGKKTADNNFLKSPEITAEFMSSEAYSELFLELLQDAQKMSDFINGMLPKDLEEFGEKVKANAQASAEKNRAPVDPDDKRPAWIREDREPTRKELDSMTKAQLVEVMQRRNR